MYKRFSGHTYVGFTARFRLRSFCKSESLEMIVRQHDDYGDYGFCILGLASVSFGKSPGHTKPFRSPTVSGFPNNNWNPKYSVNQQICSAGFLEEIFKIATFGRNLKILVSVFVFSDVRETLGTNPSGFAPGIWLCPALLGLRRCPSICDGTKSAITVPIPILELPTHVVNGVSWVQRIAVVAFRFINLCRSDRSLPDLKFLCWGNPLGYPISSWQVESQIHCPHRAAVLTCLCLWPFVFPYPCGAKMLERACFKKLLRASAKL